MKQRFRELDGLRGIAALAVVFSHFTGAHNSRYVDDPQAWYDVWWGAFGVSLFFMISGFVILMTAQAGGRSASPFPDSLGSTQHIGQHLASP